MDQERLLFDTLKSVSGFEIGPDGLLTLVADGGQSVVLRRREVVLGDCALGTITRRAQA